MSPANPIQVGDRTFAPNANGFTTYETTPNGVLNVGQTNAAYPQLAAEAAAVEHRNRIRQAANDAAADAKDPR